MQESERSQVEKALEAQVVRICDCLGVVALDDSDGKGWAWPGRVKQSLIEGG